MSAPQQPPPNETAPEDWQSVETVRSDTGEPLTPEDRESQTEPADKQTTDTQTSAPKPFPAPDDFGRNPFMVTCPRCKHEGQSVTQLKCGAVMSITVAILCVFTCILAVIPFCMNSCYDVHHHCAKCGGRFGVYYKTCC